LKNDPVSLCDRSRCSALAGRFAAACLSVVLEMRRSFIFAYHKTLYPPSANPGLSDLGY